jgi:protein SCO1
MLLLATGCHRPAALTPADNVAHFGVRGKVISTDTATGEVTLDAAAIPGFMDAMTMPYKLAQPGVLSELHPGDRITAQINVVKDADGFHDALLDQIVVVAQARPDYVPAVQYHVPQVGDAVPDFKLLNQSGKIIHLSQFKGQVLLVTFIYTRCPLSDYCPRMSRNFAAIDSKLASDPKLYAKTHLLSISFDPAYDKPAVLRSYGGAYTENYTKEQFAHWDFAAPPKAELPAVTQYFNVGITPGENGTLAHSLSTILIGKDGKIVAWYPTNDWQPQDIVQAMKDAAAN